MTPQSNDWVYDANTQTLTVFADPTSVTIIYTATSAPVPEFPTTLGLVLIGCLAITLFFAKKSETHARSTHQQERRR